jgi:hypothetical protein
MVLLPSAVSSSSSAGKSYAGAYVATGLICPIRGPLSFVDSWGFPRATTGWHQGVDLMSPRGTPNVAVVSVVQVNELADVRPAYIDALERVLHATRPDLVLVPQSRVEAALNDSTSRFLLLGYQMHGSADPAWLKRAAASLRPLARYGILARLDDVVVRHVDRVDPTSDPAQRSDTGQIRVTGQDAHVSVHVYDLETSGLVFSGAYWGSKEVALSEGEEMPPRESATDDTDVSTPYDSTVTGLYLKAPTLVRSLEKAFVEFARSLPGGSPR